MTIDDLPRQEPMRPQRKLRRMRRSSRAHQPFRPDLDSLLNAAGRVDLMRTRTGRFADLSGRPVDQTLARDALRGGLIAKTTWPGDSTYLACFLPAEQVARIAALDAALDTSEEAW